MSASSSRSWRRSGRSASIRRRSRWSRARSRSASASAAVDRVEFRLRLILLAERPIRVGDQIVVKSEEGFVRRISVRATEIETVRARERHHSRIPS
jgi:hypothetical protein